MNATGSLAQADTAAVITPGAWQHAAGVVQSSASRTPYANGSAGPTQTTTVPTPNAFDFSAIGSRNSSAGFGQNMNGDIAEVGIWNVALTAAEIAALAKGVTCDQIRPQSLVFYAPLVRDLVDVRGGLIITNNNGATVADHPRIYT